MEGAYVIAAGKTGGHIFPGISLAREIRAQKPEAPILFVGTSAGLESRLVPEAGFALECVEASGFVGRGAAGKLAALARLPVGFFQARSLLRRHKASAVAGMGGYVIVPVLAAARSLGIPTLVHDSDALPGLASRMVNRFATRTAIGFEQARSHFGRPAVLTGTPVRKEFFAIQPIDPLGTTRRLLVIGGSQGAAVLNRVVASAADLLAAGGVEVVHQTGNRHLASTRAAYGAVPPGFRLEAFLPRLHEELAWADLVVARAGAMTLAELAAAGRPAILVPFGSAAHGHQLVNAQVLVTAGAATVVEESAWTPRRLVEIAEDLFSHRPRLADMGLRARSLAVPDAARRLAELLFQAEASSARAGA